MMRVGLFLAAFVIAAAAMLTSAPAGAADGCFPPAGYMRSIQGQVEIKRGAVDWRPAALDEPLCAGDLIRVGDRSRALVAIADLTQRIDQNTTLSLTYVPEDKPAVVGLIEGAVYFFSRKPRVLEVDTPYFDAAVEGTEFLVRVEAQRALLTVFDGRITARNAQGELTVANGQSVVAEARQAPAPYVLVRPRDAVQWALFYPIILFPLADRSGAAAREIAGPLGEAVELASRGAFAAAFARFEAIPDPNRGPEFYLYRAATLLSVGRVEDAGADIDQALARDTSDGRAYALSAVIAVAQNERDRALEDAQRGVELSPHSAAARIALSYAEQARFRIEAARETMQQAMQDESDNALAWARLSELWLMQGYRDRALKAARKARKLAPELERVETVLGFAALAAIDIARAKQAFARAVDLNSADPQARFGLGLATIRGGDLERGRGDIELAVGLDPDDSLLRSYLGKAYFDSRTTDPAKYLRELFTNFPNQENTLAAEQYGIAKRLDPNDPTPWLYDAIRKQSENRPVEALHDIEKSIELNDNRAVYRSRELLDQDQAARGTSLARIYNDLGFQQLGVNQASRSLTFDPGNAAAHRFLSDTYATLPRRDVARVSELLQAQLLQDININPVQPSLSVTNLDVFTGGGPTRIGVNEYTPLFERNQTQLNVSGEVGDQSTLADEAVVSGIYDWLSLSAGQYHYGAGGFRKNFDLYQNIYDIFAQAAVTPKANVQGELRSRQTDSGNRNFNFERPSAPSDPNLTRGFDEKTARVGVRYSPSPHSDFITSFIYGDVKDQTQSSFKSESKATSAKGEGQYVMRGDKFNFLTGFDVYNAQTTLTLRTPNSFSQHQPNTTGASGYAYSNIVFSKSLLWTIAASYDYYVEDPLFSPFTGKQKLHRKQFNPKTGIQTAINDNLSVRAAIFRNSQIPVITNRTIEPTQIAGVNRVFDDPYATESWTCGAGLDARISESIYTGVEFFARQLDVVSFSTRGGRWSTQNWYEKLYSSYLYWAISDELAITLRPVFENFNAKSNPRVETSTVPFALRYFSPSGLFAGAGASFVHQDVRRKGGNDGSEDFFTADAGIGYRFPFRRGIIGLEARNLSNERFRYQDTNFRTFGGGPPFLTQFLPERSILLSLNMNL